MPNFSTPLLPPNVGPGESESSLFDDLLLEDWCAAKGIPCDARCAVEPQDEECRTDDRMQVHSTAVVLTTQIYPQEAGNRGIVAVDGQPVAAGAEGQPDLADIVDWPVGKTKPGRARLRPATRGTPWRARDIPDDRNIILPVCGRRGARQAWNGPWSSSGPYPVCDAGPGHTALRLVHFKPP